MNRYLLNKNVFSAVGLAFFGVIAGGSVDTETSEHATAPIRTKTPSSQALDAPRAENVPTVDSSAESGAAPIPVREGAHAGETRVLRSDGELELSMVWCPAGDVLEYRSDRVNEFDEKLPSGVISKYRISKGFWIGQYEITQEQWVSVMDENPSSFKGRNKPVHGVSWNDANKFLEKLGHGWRLPTNAEWELACRAGTSTAYSFGDRDGNLKSYACFNGVGLDGDLRAAFSSDSRLLSGPEDVGQHSPNPWGIYDMHGNIAEWCQDWWHPRLGHLITDSLNNLFGIPRPDSEVKTSDSGPEIDPKGPSRGDERVVRSGAYAMDAAACRSSAVAYAVPSSRDAVIGLRVVYQSE